MVPNQIGEDLVSVDMVEKRLYLQDRFIFFIFKLHERWPYSEKVLLKEDNEIKEQDNPRSSEQIELKETYFVLIDSKFQKIYFSNRHKENHFSSFLIKHNIKNFVIKPIISEYDFVNNIETIKEISFTIENSNLVRQSGSLSKSLTEDIYGFGADEATLSLRYRKRISMNSIREKIVSVIDDRKLYKNLTIVGRDSTEFEKVFNLDGVISRISIKTTLLADTMEINIEDMIHSLILRITKNDETK